MLELTPRARELLDRADEVLLLLDSGQAGLHESLSSPLLKSEFDKNKGFRFPLPLVNAIEEFAHDKRMTQKDVFCAALVEFLMRRGKEYIEHELTTGS